MELDFNTLRGGFKLKAMFRPIKISNYPLSIFFLNPPLVSDL